MRNLPRWFPFGNPIRPDEMIGKFSSHFWEPVATPLLDRTGAHVFK
jgi:hypothetical protein